MEKLGGDDTMQLDTQSTDLTQSKLTGGMPNDAMAMLSQLTRDNPSKTVQIFASPTNIIQLGDNARVTLDNDTRSGCLSQESLNAKIKQQDKTFVRSEMMKMAKHSLKKFGHVTIVGAPGEGKTSVALALCSYFQPKFYHTLFVTNLQNFDINICINRNVDMLLVFDDIFNYRGPCDSQTFNKVLKEVVDVLGAITAENGKLEKIGKGSSHKHNFLVAFTARTYNFLEGRASHVFYNVNIFRDETVFDMTEEQITRSEKLALIERLSKYHIHTDLRDESICQSVVDSKHHVFGFPKICTMYFENSSFQVNTLDFFHYPLFYLRDDIDFIIRENNNRSAVLIFLLMCDGHLNLVHFQKSKTEPSTEALFLELRDAVPSCTRTGLAREAHNFAGTYLHVADHTASFSHASVYDAVACALGSLNPVLLLTYCSLRFIRDRVRIIRDGVGRNTIVDTVTHVVRLSPSLKTLLLDRLVEGIKQGVFSLTLPHPSLVETSMVDCLFDELDTCICTIARTKDVTDSKSFLFWASHSRNSYLVEKSLKFVDEDNIDDVYQSLGACISVGNKTTLKLLIGVLGKHGTFNINYRLPEGQTVLMVAAQSGQTRIFEHLMQQGADVMLRDEFQKSALHYACVAKRKDIVTCILSAAPNTDLTQPDVDGRTPAMLSAMAGETETVDILSDYESRQNKVN